MDPEKGSVVQTYRERSRRFAGERDRCAAHSRRVSHIRLVAFLALLVSFISPLEPSIPIGPEWLAVTAACAALFMGLVIYHNKVDGRCRWYDELSKLNDEGPARMARDWSALPEHDVSGAGHEHPFADDLDLFGRASLFSLLSTVGTAPGRRTLRAWLLQPAPPETSLERQAAVSELAPAIDLREEITVRGRLMPSATPEGVERFLTWAESEPWLRGRRLPAVLAYLLPTLTLALIALNVMGVVSWRTWAVSLGINLMFSFAYAKRVHATFDRAFAREEAFQQYAGLFRPLQTARFQAPLLQRLQATFTAQGGSAYRQMKRLHRLLDLAEVRRSMLYLPIQAFTLWDFHVLHRLEQWQVRAGRRARAWISALGEMDALASLAALRFDNPSWAFPDIVTRAEPLIEATGLGHPLLADAVRVGNDIRIGPPGTFLFITGSNMSGKSTLLRAIGTNLVLARAGAPVCAAALRLPPVILETSMRIHDSLQQGLSHFMAELQRLKGVVETARRVQAEGDGNLLYLLDDIFQGTNTVERQIAARKVISFLLATGAIGGVTSHDLQLADSEPLKSAREPMHFTERIEEGSTDAAISFDYKLRPGIATSKNALKLLEIVGLDEDKRDDAED